jgi:phosphonate transport system substrate-binding protein
MFYACSEREDHSEVVAKETTVSTESFVIGLVPQQNVFEQKKKYGPLAAFLSRSLGMNVKTKLLDSYDAIYTEMLEEKVDAAFFGSLSYVAANSKIGIDPVARKLKESGVSTYKGLVFARKGKGITENMDTWKGRRIALVHTSTTAGYIFPKFYLHQKGVTDFKSYFGKVIFTGSHDASVLSVFKGDADIGCASDQIFNQLTRENPLMREELVILAESRPVPLNVLGVRKGIKADLRARLKKTLLEMDRTSEGRDVLSSLGAVRFIETSESEFEPVLDMLNALGMVPGDFALSSIGRSGLSHAPKAAFPE